MNSIINHLGRTDSKGLTLVYSEFIVGGSFIQKTWNFDTTPSIVLRSSALNQAPDGQAFLQTWGDIALAKEYGYSAMSFYDYEYLIKAYSSMKPPSLSFNSSYTKITLYWETLIPPRNHIMFYA